MDSTSSRARGTQCIPLLRGYIQKMEDHTDQPRERTSVSATNNNNIPAYDPPQEEYCDPPPTYEEYIKTDKGPYPSETTQRTIQEQPHTIRIINVSQQDTRSGTCSGMPELLLASSIVLSVICLFVAPCALACSIPAIVVSVTAKDAFRRGHVKSGKCQILTAAILDVTAIVLAATFVTILIVFEVSRRKI